jgi:hypothetical protein
MKRISIIVLVVMLISGLGFLLVHYNIGGIKGVATIYSPGAPSYNVGAPDMGSTPAPGGEPDSSQTTTDTAQAQLAVTLTANGQTALNLPWTTPVAIGNVNSNYNYTSTSFLETFIDVAWNANHPDAQCTAYSSYAGQAATQGAPGPVGWGWEVLSASGGKKASVQGRNASYTLGITCTWNGQTASASVPVTVGAGGGAANSDVHIENNYHVTLIGNGQSGTITVPNGTNLLLAWSSNYPANSTDIRCIATGDWSWKQFTTNGQQFTGSLHSNKIYNILCNDPTSGFLQSQDTLTVYVSDNTAPIPAPTPSANCSLLNDGRLHTTTQMCAQCGIDCPTPVATAVTTPAPVSGSVSTSNTSPVPASITTVGCSQTARGIVDAAGGCKNIDSSVYKNIYNTCCQVVTMPNLLKLLDNSLSDGVLDVNEKSALLDSLNMYLSQ